MLVVTGAAVVGGGMLLTRKYLRLITILPRSNDMLLPGVTLVGAHYDLEVRSQRTNCAVYEKARENSPKENPGHLTSPST